MMGLLDMASPQQKMQQPQPQMMGGLLDMVKNQPQDNSQKEISISLAQQVAQNPTPDTVDNVMTQLQDNNIENAQEIISILSQIKNDPQKLTQFAESIIKELS